MKRMLIILAVLVCAGCTDESDTVRTLESEGFTDVHTTGWSAFACGKDDTFATAFTAKNPRGQTVSGTVCCGLLMKGCTVRF